MRRKEEPIAYDVKTPMLSSFFLGRLRRVEYSIGKQVNIILIDQFFFLYIWIVIIQKMPLNFSSIQFLNINE